ncbi:MAG: isopenicillin N synthase family oxygenase [Verrucomicrobia bacterium]|nr:isopenicillin N synthase family oxygenase [Verrucomicrobiota bacterium]
MAKWGAFLGIMALFVVAEAAEILSLDVIAYEDFVSQDTVALRTLERALLEKGIVGIRGIPGYRENVERFIEAARAFSALPDEMKLRYAPNRAAGDILGYELGAERFQRPDGKWVVDDRKVSYYAFLPNIPENKWPSEVDLQTPFESMGMMMSQVGSAVMEQIGLIGEKTGIYLDRAPRLGRMLHYRKDESGIQDNPFWCGAHFDHGMFTALLPAFYFVEGEQIPEPIEAGLFVKTHRDGVYKKVLADDPDVMLFQVGEFGQLLSNDAIRATEHLVHKAQGRVERFTMALFFDAPMDTVIHSTSVLTEDARYGGSSGEPCVYRDWGNRSFERYLKRSDPLSP